MAEGAELRYDLDTNSKVSRIDTDYTTGLAGQISANLDAAVSSRASATQATDIETDTQDIQTRIGNSDDAASASVSDAGQSIFARLRYIYTALDAAITAAIASIKGVGNRTISEVYDLVTTSADPFRLTAFKKATGTAQSFVANTWVDAYAPGVVAKDTELAGIQITRSGTVTGAAWRIVDGADAKLWPFDDQLDLRSGRLEELQTLVRIPVGTAYKVQVWCTATTGGQATVDRVDYVEHG